MRIGTYFQDWLKADGSFLVGQSNNVCMLGLNMYFPDQSLSLLGDCELAAPKYAKKFGAVFAAGLACQIAPDPFVFTVVATFPACCAVVSCVEVSC